MFTNLVRLGLTILFALAIAGQAEAVAITWDFSSGSSTPSTTSGSGYGNLYTFTVGGTVVTATAWGLTGNSLTTFETAQVARTTYGLGSCNRGEGTGCTGDVQRVDNVGQLEFLLFQFSAPVNLKQIVIDPGGSSFDRDVSYWVGNLSGSLNGIGLSGLAGLGLGTRQDLPNTSGSSMLTLSLTGDSVTSLLFGTQAALTTTTSTYDRFYIRSLIDDLPTAVPEPGTLLFLGVGLLAAGLWSRQRLSSGSKNN